MVCEASLCTEWESEQVGQFSKILDLSRAWQGFFSGSEVGRADVGRPS